MTRKSYALTYEDIVARATKYESAIRHALYDLQLGRFTKAEDILRDALKTETEEKES